MDMKVTNDQALWVAVRNRTNAIGFNAYNKFIERMFDAHQDGVDVGRLEEKGDRQLLHESNELYTPVQGIGAYELLKTATQVFLRFESGVFVEDLDKQAGTPTGCLPLIELIWSYWHEEAMLVQTMNAISLRFQNRRSAAARDPLAHLEIAPLFPLNNLLWGYVQGEPGRLSVPRRAYEYNHHYGLTLTGKAIPDPAPPDTRSRFVEAYHQLLYLCIAFFKQDNDAAIVDGNFPVLDALKDVQHILAEGAHNQFGDLPWTARAEMLMEQWVLSRSEMRQFLGSQKMVPYREPWMSSVDTMKRLQDWAETSVTHFHKLAIHGEEILLTIRYGNWNHIKTSEQAANWARYWRPEIQNYIHSYRAVTGIDLRSDPNPGKANS